MTVEKMVALVRNMSERAALTRAIRRRDRGKRQVQIGWIVAGMLEKGPSRWFAIAPPVSMRVCNLGLWMNANSPLVWNELYDPDKRYDVTIFVKAMDEKCQREAEKIRGYGGKVIFDANVNYYEVWGEYDIPGTKPTAVQQHDAVAMAKMADWVVADSSYLRDVIGKLTDRVSWIPDNVDTNVYAGRRVHKDGMVRLIWSGVAKKARPLIMVKEALRSLKSAELVLVSDEIPGVMGELEEVIPCQFAYFTERAYARLLLSSDVVISPKRLCNAYEAAHTEYKISLGMAVGLPAVASPQRSYVEAINDRGGGIIADTEKEWTEALNMLTGDSGQRTILGGRGRATVMERYATPVAARRYLELVRDLLGVAEAGSDRWSEVS